MGPYCAAPVTPSQAKPHPQLLMLAEPLMREGLLRLLGEDQATAKGDGAKGGGGPYRLACGEAELDGRPDLVIWSPGQTMPAPTLARELSLLMERWYPLPVLLLLGAEGPYPADVLLALPAAGLLQQPDAATVRQAVATLLAGGRVLDLQPEPISASESPFPSLSLGQWLLQTGLQQIQSEEARCRQWLALADPSSLSELLLQGRLRELTAARALLLWLWGPISLAWGSAPDGDPGAGSWTPGDQSDWGRAGSTSPYELPRSTAITLRERTASAVWLAIRQRLDQAAEVGLVNNSGHLLAFEGLAPQHRRDLLLALLSHLDLLLSRLRHERLRGEELVERWQQLQPELRRLALSAMAGQYVQLPQEGSLLPVAITLAKEGDFELNDPELPSPLPMLQALVQAQPLLVNGQLLAPDEPLALLQLEALISNWLIRTAELISAELLASCSTWPELRRYLLSGELLATRNLERLRNQLNAQQRWSGWFERPIQLYESRRLLYRLQGGAITPLLLTEPRDQELRRLGWLQQLVTLALESRDAIAPQLHALIRRTGDLVGLLLTQVIGRAIGLVGRGILQGMGRSLGRS